MASGAVALAELDLRLGLSEGAMTSPFYAGARREGSYLPG